MARAYQVTALPTFIVFREGNIVERVQGADPARLQNIIRTLTSEIGGGAGKDAGEGSSAAGAKKGESSAAGSSRGGGNEGGARWLGAELPRGYVDITEHVELRGCELLNADEAAGNVRVLFEPGKPSVLLNKGKAPGSNKDWVESDTDDQLLLFMPFHSMLKLHTLQVGRVFCIWPT